MNSVLSNLRVVLYIKFELVQITRSNLNQVTIFYRSIIQCSDRATLNEIDKSVKDLKEEIRELKFNFIKAKKEIAEVKTENAQLKQAINLNIYSYDDLEQYCRRENIRIYGVPESSGKKDDGEQILFEVANELGIN